VCREGPLFDRAGKSVAVDLRAHQTGVGCSRLQSPVGDECTRRLDLLVELGPSLKVCLVAARGVGGRPSMAASGLVTSASPKSASDGESWAPGPAGVIFSKNRSSSTGTGMISVLFFSPATSTTVCSSRSGKAAGSRAITLAAAANHLEAWYSPSAVMIRARRSRSASACAARDNLQAWAQRPPDREDVRLHVGTATGGGGIGNGAAARAAFLAGFNQRAEVYQRTPKLKPAGQGGLLPLPGQVARSLSGVMPSGRTHNPIAGTPSAALATVVGMARRGSCPGEPHSRRFQMPSKKRTDEALARVRQAAAQLQPAAAKATPLARSTGAAAKRGVHRTRAWAAPRVEHTGQVLEDSVAPQVSALLSSVAQLLEPDKPRHRRWRTPIAIAAVAAAALAAAAIVRHRRKPDSTTPEADADDVAPAADMGDGQTRTNTDADADVKGL
jgi:hypothetical protein